MTDRPTLPTTYCNVTKGQVPVLNGLAFTHYSRPGQPCACDQPFVAPWRRRSIEQAGGRFLAVADTTDR
jgi:hypothetical protein